jgi:hypothetical protein
MRAEEHSHGHNRRQFSGRARIAGNRARMGGWRRSKGGGVVRRLVWLAFVVLSTALFASPAHAAAVVLRDSASHTHVFTTGEFFCLPPDQVGTVTFTENSTGQFVETDGGVFTFHGVDAFDIRVDFPDGSYIQSGLDRDLKSFVLNPPLTVFTVITQDMETIYNAQGLPIGTIAVHIVSHLTYTDLNGNGQPDDGEVKAQVDQFRLRCT